MYKKVLMSFALLVFITTGMVFAQAPTLDKLRVVGSTGNASINAANNSISGEVVIPDTWEGRPVTNIQSFQNCTGITSVIIPASMISINLNAFNGCTNLTSVTFQKTGVRNTGASSFPGDLVAKYQAGGAGTYTRQPGGTVWTKQAGRTICPHCNGTGYLD